jgi:molecular chaperone DnaK
MRFRLLIPSAWKPATRSADAWFSTTSYGKAISCPRSGKKTFKAEESLKAGSTGSIKFKLWEGEISDPINDNRFIGMFEIKGSDFDDGVIAAGAELICEYEVLDSGNIILEVSVPSISGSFHSGRNFYSRQEGKVDYTNQAKNIQEQSEHTLAAARRDGIQD